MYSLRKKAKILFVITFFFLSYGILQAKQSHISVRKLQDLNIITNYIITIPNSSDGTFSTVPVTVNVGPQLGSVKCNFKYGWQKFTGGSCGACARLPELSGSFNQVATIKVFQAKKGLREQPVPFSYRKALSKLAPHLRKLLQKNISQYYEVNPKYKKMLFGKRTHKNNITEFIKKSFISEESSQIHILPNERFSTFYEIYVPKGIKSTKHKYFYVHVSVGQELIGISKKKVVTAIATFEGVRYHKMSIVKMIPTKTGLQTIKRKYISRSSPYYPLIKKAIRKSLREYDSWQQKFNAAFKDIAFKK